MTAVLQALGLVGAVAALLAFLLASDSRRRAAGLAVALVVTPLLLASQVAASDELGNLSEHARLFAATSVVAIAATVGLAWVFHFWPSLFPILALVALPFRVPVAIGGTSASLLLPLYAVVAAAALNFVARQLGWTVRLRRPTESSEVQPAGNSQRWLVIVLATSVALYAAQILYSAHFEKGLDQVVFFLLPFAVLFKLLSEADWTRRLVGQCALTLVGLAVAFSLIGFWEYESRTLFWNSSVIDANQFAAYFRVNSVFFDPNIFGRFLAIAMLVVVGTMLWRIRPRWYLALVLAAAVLWGGLLISFSQSSFGALLIGLAVLAGLRWSIRWTLVTAASVLVCGALFVGLFSDALNVRLDRFKSLNVATSGRLELIGGGLTLFAQRPLQGHGSGSFSRAYRQQQDSSAETALTASHTTPVTIAAEQGLLGLVAYLAVLVAAVLTVLRLARSPPVKDAAFAATAAVLTAGLAAVVFHTMIYAAFFEDPTVWVLLALGVALARQRGFAPQIEPVK